jgi:hypothetical protein
MRSIIWFFIALCTVPCAALAQPHIDFDRVGTAHGGATTGIRYTISAEELLKYTGERITIDNFPVSYGQRASIALSPMRSPLDDRTARAGEATAARAPTAVWRGSIVGESESRVVIVITNGYFFASIERKGLSPVMLCPDRHDPHASLLISQSDLLACDSARPMRCLNEDMQELDRCGISTTSVRYYPKPELHHDLLQTEIAVEADSCFFSAAGGRPDLVEAYINALFAMSSAIYEDEAQITLHISWLKLWDSGDPYDAKGNAYAMPDTVRSYWKAHYADVPRDIAHVMTSIGYGGGGFGWLAMCGTDYGYSVSSPRTHEPFPTFAFTYDAYIVSHEIGHNFGLPHSHSCYWAPPLDTCYTHDDSVLQLNDGCFSKPITPRKNPGTIMSYCANANYQLSGRNFSEYKLQMTFSPRVADTLRRNAESYFCIAEPPEATLRLLTPARGVTLSGDTTIAIRWSSAHVEKVNTRYSLDGGTTWTTIAENLAAANGTVQWKVPNVTAASALVLVSDVLSPLVADTSLLPFAITPRASVSVADHSETLTFYPMAVALPASFIGADYEVIDLLGKIVRLGAIDPSCRIETRTLTSGVYILRIQYHGAKSYRFVR